MPCYIEHFVLSSSGDLNLQARPIAIEHFLVFRSQKVRVALHRLKHLLSPRLHFCGSLHQQVVPLLVELDILLCEFVPFLSGFQFFHVGVGKFIRDSPLPLVDGIQDRLIKKAFQQPHQDQKVDNLCTDGEPIDQHQLVSCRLGNGFANEHAPAAGLDRLRLQKHSAFATALAFRREPARDFLCQTPASHAITLVWAERDPLHTVRIQLCEHLDLNFLFGARTQHRVDQRQLIIEMNIHDAATHGDHGSKMNFGCATSVDTACDCRFIVSIRFVILLNALALLAALTDRQTVDSMLDYSRRIPDAIEVNQRR